MYDIRLGQVSELIFYFKIFSKFAVLSNTY